MSQLTPGKYTIINVAQERAIGLRLHSDDRKPVVGLGPNHLNKIWNIKSVERDDNQLKVTLEIGGYPIDSTIHGDSNATPAKWIIEVDNGKYTIRNLDPQPKYWTLGAAPSSKVTLSINSSKWNIVPDFEVRGFTMILGLHTVTLRPHFAFGSNLSPTQMRDRCKSSHYICVAVLRNWKWIINNVGVASIVHTGRSSDVVYGSVYNLQVDDEAELDAREGGKYSKVALSIQIGFEKEKTTGWQMVDAMTYVDTKRLSEGPPRPEYIPRMNNAIKHALLKGVPWDYVRTSMLRFFSDEFKRDMESFQEELQRLRDSIGNLEGLRNPIEE